MERDSLSENWPSKRHVTLSDLARELGLSKRAVSQALRERPGTVRISKETQEKVRLLAEQLGYRQNPAARAMFTGRSGIFGVLGFHSHMHSAQIRLATAVEEFQKRGQIPIVVHAWTGDGDPDLRNAHLLIDARVNGVLLLGGSSIAQRYVEEIRSYGIPIVVVASSDIKGVANFGVRRQQGFRLLAEHLIGRGHRRLAAMVRRDVESVSGSLSTQETLMGIREAIQVSTASGIPIAFEEIDTSRFIRISELGRVPDLHGLHSDGYLAMWEIIEKGNLPDAILCQVDGIAFGALRACAEAGIRIPDDLSITGYGNDPVSTASTTPLTTIAEPDIQLCALAVRHLMTLSESGDPGTFSSKILPGKLLVRRSSSKEWGNLPKDLFAIETASHSETPAK